MKALAFVALVLTPLSALGQAQNFDSPKALTPTVAELKTITDKTAQLAKALQQLRGNVANERWLPDVESFHDAAVNIVKHKEYFNKDSAAWAVEVLDKGLARAAALAKNDTTWTDAPGKITVRGFRSKIDDTAQ